MRGGKLSFFFQAEDGIRDLTVTGVQTCALPISGRSLATPTAARGRGAVTRDRPASGKSGRPSGVQKENQGVGGQDQGRPDRSEERRVGKEWRQRGEPEDQKKTARLNGAVIALAR